MAPRDRSVVVLAVVAAVLVGGALMTSADDPGLGFDAVAAARERVAEAPAAGSAVDARGADGGVERAADPAVPRAPFIDEAAGDATVPRFRARILWNGAPAESTEVQIRWKHPDGARKDGPPPEVLVTDAAGEVEFTAPLLPTERRAGWSIVFNEASGTRDGELTVATPQGLEPGFYDLGSLEIVPFPVFAEGRVVGDDGSPVRGAVVRWAPVGEAFSGDETPTTTDGLFVARTPRDEVRDRLVWAEARDHDPAPAVLTRRGARDLRLVLRRRARMPLRVVYQGAPLEGVFVEAAAYPAARRSGPLPSEWIDAGADGVANLGPFTAGPTVLAVRLSSRRAASNSLTNSDRCVVWRATTETAPGQTTAPLAFDPVEISTRVRRLRARVVDDLGAPVAWARVFVRVADAAPPDVESSSDGRSHEYGASGAVDAEGRFFAYAPPGRVTWRAETPGHADACDASGGDEVVLTLRAQRTVAFAWEGAAPATPVGAAFALRTLALDDAEPAVFAFPIGDGPGRLIPVGRRRAQLVLVRGAAEALEKAGAAVVDPAAVVPLGRPFDLVVARGAGVAKIAVSAASAAEVEAAAKELGPPR